MADESLQWLCALKAKHLVERIVGNSFRVSLATAVSDRCQSVTRDFQRALKFDDAFLFSRHSTTSTRSLTAR
jgi:hypothetical protein